MSLTVNSLVTVPRAEIIVDPTGRSHVVYHIHVRCSDKDKTVKVIGRRFSDFRKFDSLWRSTYPTVAIQLPPKVWFGNQSQSVIEQRRYLLQNYLMRLCTVSCLKSQLSKFLEVPEDILFPKRNNGHRIRQNEKFIETEAGNQHEDAEESLAHSRRRSQQ